ncbi:hypothetical protein HZH66_011258 [Vespula vulgaris]|uniref:Phospholipid scramblase n=1 Tax=Vespula vulgaris TaxID=7454 RepID=A0A834JJX4_VESVU|nr:phospholipid scramblase 2 isoform X2 [Vespula vulgaris]KAF7386806.1 hypothetical protein HZH66_011258 [Vespula vulgaris]
MSNPYLQPSYSIPMPMNQPGTQPIASAPSPNEFPLPYAPQVPQGGWPIPNMICPPGLEYLMGLDHLFVKQKFEMLEVVTGWETRNKYNVMNIRGEQVYYVCEQSNCCSRFCCGTYRSCEFKVFDGIRREILHMIRPLRCNSCCCPCCLQELEVYSGGILLGSVVQDWTLFRPWFSILNANGDTVLKIKGPLLRFCVEVDFKVKSADGTQGVGMISKHWSGITREYFTDTDNFGISFPIDLDVKIKAVLLGACLLIDFMYFETSKE